ncbi:hypothetical protein [Xanthomonas sp. 4461]|uniref:hypothetical protein n=1 Tax=Xanthomonas sp. 4461 TaxID=3035313 RepID=UPI002167E72D|nr:hypothetical protein [Xanthomonas sp. 4461]MCS3809233.1 hypothetical protein [Xanthomonas sp. 4461]
MSNDPAVIGTPMEQHNIQVLALLESRLISGMQAALQSCEYYVIRHQETGVIATTASTTVGNAQEVVFGPGTFPACNAYINSAIVTQLAHTSPKFHTHQPPTTASPSEGALT